MPTCRCCPGAEDFHALLDGTLPDEEQARLTTHLDTCEGCQQRLESLSGLGFPLEGGRQADTPTPALACVMRRLCGDTDAFEASEAEEANAPLHLLVPSGHPGALGRFGPYEVVEVLGRGGMGVVFKALDPTLGRFIALKVLAPQLAASASARQRFAREARATAAVQHENVVPIHTVDSANGLPYLVMPCVPGGSLQRRLDREGPLPVAEVARIGMQVAAGLATAHTCGLVHRDIKPGNILVQEAEAGEGESVARLTDFGLARLRDDASVTHSGFLAGTPQYMSPEQARGEAIDYRTDLFSLGSVLYAMCTGRPPFEASTTLAVLRRVSEEEPAPVRTLNPRVPDWLEEIMTRLLAKDPARRPASAGEVSRLLAWHLERLSRGEEIPPRPETPSRRHRWLGVAAGVMLLLAGLTLTEATGRTRLGAWLADVIRVKTPEGTLVIQVNDPSVKVTVDGEEVVIGGEGLAEVRIRAGKHRVKATKGAETVHDEVVRITRDGKEVVRVTVERPAEAPTPSGMEPTRTLRGHVGPVRALAVSPDGRWVATGGDDRTVRLFDRATGKPLLVQHGHKGAIVSVGFLPGGKGLVSVDDRGEVKTWDLPSGKQRSRATMPEGVRVGVVAPAGGRLATTDDTGAVRLWKVDDKVEGVASLTAGKAVSSVAFSPDGSRLAAAGDGSVRVWDVSPPIGRRPVVMWQLADAKTGRIRSLAFSPDGKLLASGGEKGPVIIWDARTGKRIRWWMREKAVSEVAFDPKVKWVALVKGAEIQVLDVATREVRSRLKGAGGTITRILFSPAGDAVLAASTDGTVRIWELDEKRAKAPDEPGEFTLRAGIHFSRKRSLRIPFVINVKGVTVEQVRLYVTDNGGRSYRLAGKAAPGDGSFAFVAPQDGDYGFIVQTISEIGALPGVVSGSPTLRVIVDTEKPMVWFGGGPAALPGDPNAVPVPWEVKDRNLDLSTLRLEYRPVGGEAWVPVWTKGKVPDKLKGIEYLTTKMKLPLEVRLRVADFAGNVGEATATLKAR